MAFDNTTITFPQINQRRTAAGTWDLNSISAEAITTSLDADSLYTAQLAEVPAAANTDGSNAAPTMTNSGGGGSYTLTTSTSPSAGEFYVDYDNGVVIVNSADHTAQSGAFEVTYSGKGTVLKADEINAIMTNSTTLNSNIVTSSLTTVGALNSGSITSGFGAIDNGTSNITTGGILKIDIDGTAENAAGSLTLGAGDDAGIFFNGTDLVVITNGAGASGIILDSEDDTVEIKGSGVLQATFDTGGLDLVTGDEFSINGASVLNATTLGTSVVTSSLTTVGALNSGSITSGFGAIDNGASNITTTGQISGGTITDGTASLTSGAWTGVTSITVGNTGIVVGSSTPFSDSSGTLTLQNIDALDATTEATIEAAIDTLSNLTTVGALNSGSITSGFGAIDNGTSNITTGGVLAIDVDGTGVNAAGSITMGAGQDLGIYWDGDEAVIEQSTGLTNSITDLVLLHNTSGTPANGIGVGVLFKQETSASNVEEIAAIRAVTTDVTGTSEDADIDFYVQNAGGALFKALNLGADGATFASPSGTNLVATLQPAGDDAAFFRGNANRSGTDSYVLAMQGQWNSTTVAEIDFATGDDTTNKDDGYIIFSTAQGGSLSERMRIEQDGKVGIGGAPSVLLDIISGSVGDIIQMAVTGVASFEMGVGGAAGATPDYWYVSANEGDPALVVEDTGYVGIGTTSPDVDLEVEKSSAGSNVGIKVQNLDESNTASNAILSATVGTSSGSTSGDPMVQLECAGVISWYMNMDNSDSDKLKFGTSISDSKLIIDTSGKIGVGASPLTNMATGDLLLEGGSLVLKEITTPTADTNYGKIYTKTDNKLYFQDGAGTEHEIAFV